MKTTTNEPMLPNMPAATFKNPSLEEVLLFGAKLGMSTDEATKFWCYYESNGWKVGRNPMKKWHVALSGWKVRDQQQGEKSRFWQDREKLKICEEEIKRVMDLLNPESLRRPKPSEIPDLRLRLTELRKIKQGLTDRLLQDEQPGAL